MITLTWLGHEILVNPTQILYVQLHGADETGRTAAIVGLSGGVNLHVRESYEEVKRRLEWYAARRDTPALPR